MNMHFFRKLPIPKEIKEQYPATPEVAALLAFIREALAAVHSAILVDQSLLVTLLFPAYRHLHALIAAGARARPRARAPRQRRASNSDASDFEPPDVSSEADSAAAAPADAPADDDDAGDADDADETRRAAPAALGAPPKKRRLVAHTDDDLDAIFPPAAAN